MTAGYLLDTNVVSVAAPERRALPLATKIAARAWIQANQSVLYLPATAIAEVASGIGLKEASGATRYARELAAWLSELLDEYPDRVLPFDLQAAFHAHRLVAHAHQAGIVPDFPDLSIACIARANDLAVATRNLKHFLPMGVAAVDPFAA